MQYSCKTTVSAGIFSRFVVMIIGFSGTAFQNGTVLKKYLDITKYLYSLHHIILHEFEKG